jgi:hypothetical protein
VQRSKTQYLYLKPCFNLWSDIQFRIGKCIFLRVKFCEHMNWHFVDSSFFLSLHLSFSIFRSNWQSYFMEVSGLNIIYWYIYADKELTTNLTSMIFRYVIHTTLTTLGLYVRFSAFLTTHNCLFNFSKLCSNR